MNVHKDWHDSKSGQIIFQETAKLRRLEVEVEMGKSKMSLFLPQTAYVRCYLIAYIAIYIGCATKNLIITLIFSKEVKILKEFHKLIHFYWTKQRWFSKFSFSAIFMILSLHAIFFSFRNFFVLIYYKLI